MAVVVDANLFIVMVGNDPRASEIQVRIDSWVLERVALHAPSLMPYEVANGLTRLVSAGAFPVDRLASAWQSIFSLPIRYHPLDLSSPAVVNIARQLRRSTAYDAAYIALAEHLGAELWTLDGPLARNAASVGFSVRLL